MSNIEPKVTIVTPSYNQAAFLEQTIRSVLAQDYPHMEYFVVDGGSNDGSQEIIKKYADQIDWWVSEPDEGQSDAVNKGWQRATGELIGWLNSDDLLMPGAVSRMVAAFNQTPEMGVIYGDVFSIDEYGEIFNIMRFDQWGLDDLMSFEIISQPGAFMRREVLQNAGYLDSSMHFLMDTHLWLKMAQHAPIRYLPGVIAAARYHAGAKNVGAGARYGQDAYRIVEWMKNQPVLQARMPTLLNRIWAGAHRLSARYLLDGGDARAALRDYLRSFRHSPAIALKESNRFLFSTLSLLGLQRLRVYFYDIRLALRRRRYPQVYGNVERFLSAELSLDLVDQVA